MCSLYLTILNSQFNQTSLPGEKDHFLLVIDASCLLPNY